MPSRLDLPPALRALADVAAGLVRRAPSARIAIARAGAVIDPAALPADARAAFEREVAVAREAVGGPMSRRDVERALREAWGRPPGRVLDDLDAEPLAVRPAAQVHRGALNGDPVAVKVRRPGVERAVRNDLALLDTLAGPLRAAFPRLDAGAVLRDAREQALDELDFEHEASQQRRVARALRDVPGVAVPRPHLDLCAAGVLVSDLLDGAALAGGARPPDPAAAARALVAAFRAATLDAGLAPVDARPGHVLVRPDGTLGLLGMGVARPVDRARAAQALDALGALAAGDAEAFATVVAASGVLPAAEARTAHALLRELLGDLTAGAATLDAAALRAVAGRAARAAPELAALATAAAPEPQDLALARMLAQLVAVLARFEATADWPALARGAA
ncbi:MAG TPA: AarF/UbiB family protein [Solirubrobacteraceae bacterium]|nr:AarF/UbiB family protein [Solirubrobacteraceae bacterium]